MGGQLCSVCVFETAEQLQMALIVWNRAILRVCVARFPKILIKKGNIFLNRNGEILVLFHIFFHPFSAHILRLVQNDVYPFLEYAFLAAIPSIEFLIEMNHRIPALCIGPRLSVINQLEYSILDENNSNLFRRNTLTFQGF